MAKIPLRDLEAEFLVSIDNRHFRPVDQISEAHGIKFLCPLCFTKNGGAIGTHMVICWSRRAPDDLEPLPGRWSLHGTGLDDLHLESDPVGTARSVELLGGCAWHGFINTGFAEGGF